jgi:two-component system cell cycle response regulator
MKILIADDDPISVLYLQDMLGEWGYDVAVAADGATACDILRQPDGPVLAVLDWMMPRMDGIDVCRAIRDTVKDRYVYMIMLTSRTETEFIVAAMNAGADDYIGKPFNSEEMQVRVRAGRRIAELEQELRLLASRDALTGIANRGAIIDVLQRELARRARTQEPVSVIFCDLDHFKSINDTYGHLAGDDVLREVTRRMAATLRPYDSFGRYGGEELLGVLPNCQMQGALEVAERMRDAVAAKPVSTQYGEISCTVSIGVAAVDRQETATLGGLLHRADGALYRAKANGRNCITIAP